MFHLMFQSQGRSSFGFLTNNQDISPAGSKRSECFPCSYTPSCSSEDTLSSFCIAALPLEQEGRYQLKEKYMFIFHTLLSSLRIFSLIPTNSGPKQKPNELKQTDRMAWMAKLAAVVLTTMMVGHRPSQSAPPPGTMKDGVCVFHLNETAFI